MTLLRRIPVAAVCLLALAAVNYYLCQELFFTDFNAHTNSIQGLWISLARLAGEHWFQPSWWPYQDAGIPFEHTYMPLVPAATALLAHLAQVPPARAFHAVMGLVLCLGPITFFILAWRLSRAPVSAFWAALAYSLTSPARALLPEPDWNPVRFWSSQRIYTSAVWDDLPHQAAVCLLPLALLFLWRALEQRRPVYYVLAIVTMALTLLPSVFGATALALGVVCMLGALPRQRLAASLRLLATLGAAAYLLVAPFLPPSLIATARANQQHFVEDRWSMRSLAAILLLLCAGVILRRLLHRGNAAPWLRFVALFALVTAAIPLLDAYLNLHFLPQPNRYHFELEMGLALAAVPLLAWLAARTPPRIVAALSAFFLCVAAQHAESLRRFTVDALRPVDITQRIEYRVARWMEARFPHQRVMVTGSIAQWFNVFTDTPQLSGSSYSTTPNWTQQRAMTSILTAATRDELETAVLWAKAFGVQALMASGRQSPEFWKGRSSTRFDGLLPVLWHEQDTTIYGVPQRSPSLAHVIPAAAAHGDLRQYVAALDDPALPLAEMRWNSLRSASIRASAATGQAISVQTCYHPGWRAQVNGHAARVRRDGLGMLLLDPACSGPCVVELTYDGGWEYRICRGLSWFALLGLVAYASVAVRRARPS